MVDNKEILEYYNANQREFLIPQSIDVVKFYSKDSTAIERVVQSRGKSVAPNVKSENEVLQTAALNPQIVLSFAQGNIGDSLRFFL